jgi:hypothetical protein
MQTKGKLLMNSGSFTTILADIKDHENRDSIGEISYLPKMHGLELGHAQRFF